MFDMIRLRFAAATGVITAALAMLPVAGPSDPQEAPAMQKHGESAGVKVERAVCVLQPTQGSDTHGVVHFIRDGDNVRIRGEIRGLSPGQHGFHVHEYGDLRSASDGKSAGSHYAPRGRAHGRRSDKRRHVGDLGNVTADENGVARIDIRDSVVSLDGPHAVIGRGLVVHAEEDEFVQPTGDAGARAALGVIGIANPEYSE